MLKFAIAGGLSASIALGLTFAEKSVAGSAPAASAFCDQSLANGIPQRSTAAPSGSELAKGLQGAGDDEREEAIRRELLAGNIPQFLRRLQPVTLSGAPVDGAPVQITMCVMPDYLAVGSDEDFLLIPMRLETALDVAAHDGFMLPTPKMVDAIYAQAAVHLDPQPLPAGDAMRSTDYYRHHNELVREQRSASGATEGLLTSGDKKDLVLTNRLWRNLDRVAIYGWHRRDGNPIQPLSTIHGWHYADYSHGVRLVSDTILVNGVPQSLSRALEDSRLAALLSSEGVIPKLRQLVDTLRQPRVKAILAELSPQ